MQYPHLHLTEWPFRIVPDPSFYSFMADRADLASQINGLLRNLSRRPSSSMHLMWAWFGAGKTHTLRHMEWLCKKHYPQVIPVYTEFPKSATRFLDIYRAFIQGMDVDLIKDSYAEVFSSPNQEELQNKLHWAFPDLSSALQLLFQGRPDEQNSVVRWLRTDLKERRLLKSVGILRPIGGAEDGTNVISWIIRIIALAASLQGDSKRVMWMLDEYQRIEALRASYRDEINGCLHSIFNACANGLTIVISFSGYPEERRLPTWLSPEIRDRIGIEKPILLPALSVEQSYSFVVDILDHFRDNTAGCPTKQHPFTRDAIEEVIATIVRKAQISKRKDQPKPRTIMHFFHTILEEAEPLLEAGQMKTIDKEFVTRVLEPVGLPQDE